MLFVLSSTLGCDHRGRPPAPTPPAGSGAHPIPTGAERVGNAAVIDRDSDGPWAPECRRRRECPPLPALARCAPGLRVVDSSTLGAAPPGVIGQMLAVRGPIVVSSILTTNAYCQEQAGVRGCCNLTSAKILVGTLPRAVVLERFACSGDDSRLCCDAPAFGETLVAVGKLTNNRSSRLKGVEWMLEDAALCEEAEPSSASRGEHGCSMSPRAP